MEDEKVGRGREGNPLHPDAGEEEEEHGLPGETVLRDSLSPQLRKKMAPSQTPPDLHTHTHTYTRACVRTCDLGSMLELLNQTLWKWGQVICKLTNLPGYSDVQPKSGKLDL